MSKSQILLVEDDEMISSGLVYALEQEGYTVSRARSVREAKEATRKSGFDLALLDMQLPDGTGLDALEDIIGCGASVIFLTVVDDEGNIVRAFESGAIDYVTKPFHLRELLARIKVAIEKKSGKPGEHIAVGNVRIDTASRKVYAGEALLSLTAVEYRLLLVFATNKGQILSRNQLLDHLWDNLGDFVEDNTLSVYVKRLREKLGDSVNIETIRRVGYRAT
jgi:DNA-binding response OmpR family regulator